MISIELIKAIDTCESDMKNKLEINQKYHMQNSKNFFWKKKLHCEWVKCRKVSIDHRFELNRLWINRNDTCHTFKLQTFPRRIISRMKPMARSKGQVRHCVKYSDCQNNIPHLGEFRHFLLRNYSRSSKIVHFQTLFSPFLHLSQYLFRYVMSNFVWEWAAWNRKLFCTIFHFALQLRQSWYFVL